MWRAPKSIASCSVSLNRESDLRVPVQAGEAMFAKCLKNPLPLKVTKHSNLDAILVRNSSHLVRNSLAEEFRTRIATKIRCTAVSDRVKVNQSLFLA